MNGKPLLLALLAAVLAVACKPQSAAKPSGAAEGPTALSAGVPADPPIGTEPSASHANTKPKGFSGVFEGSLPCADCAGIDTLIELSGDGTYTLQERYQGKPDNRFIHEGTWTRDASDNIRLHPKIGSDEGQRYEIISDDEIRLLDQQGGHIDSDLPYSLKRRANHDSSR